MLRPREDDVDAGGETDARSERCAVANADGLLVTDAADETSAIDVSGEAVTVVLMCLSAVPAA